MTTYAGTESLRGKVWAGDDQAEAVTFTPTWSVAASGTVAFTLSAVNTALLTAGSTYTLAVDVQDGGTWYEVVRTWLAVASRPGATTALTTYCTFDDMRQVAGAHIGNLLTEADQAGFAEQRHRARVEFERLLQSRYRGGATYRRQVNLDHMLDGLREYRSGYQDATLQTYLDASYLIVTGPTGEAVKRWNALMACAFVYERQMGGDGSTDYRRQAAQWRAEAAALASCLVVGVKASANESPPSLQINLGIADTLRL